MKNSIATGLIILISLTALASCGGSSDREVAGERASPRASNDIDSLDRDSRESSSPSSGTNAASNTTGRLLASNCFACHGTDGRSSGGFDRLAGESVNEIVEEMREMRTEDEGIMTVHALGYTDEQVRLLAQYFASR